MNSPILAPAAVLILWSVLILLWVLITRLKAFANAGITLGTAEPGTRYGDVEAQMPASVNWKSHNFVHLMEQPTLFYGVVAILALAAVVTPPDVISQVILFIVVYGLYEVSIFLVARVEKDREAKLREEGYYDDEEEADIEVADDDK